MTTPPPPQPSAGWYPDPTGKPGQMYWDGEAWHRLTPDIPATPKADIPGTPKPTQPPETTKPVSDKLDFLLGPSGQRGKRNVLAGLGLLVAIAVLVMHNHGSSPSSLSSPSQSQSPAQSQSPYYQEGYTSGTSGLARNGYGDDMYNTGATVAEMEHNACSGAINNEPNNASINDADHPGNQDDYMNGCLQAFTDHPPAAKPKPGPLNPYR